MKQRAATKKQAGQHALADTSLQAGRDAFARHAWQEAFDLLTAADASGDLSPEDLEILAEAAWWIGRIDQSIQARERVYATYVEGGNRRRAAFLALKLADDYSNKLAGSIAAGWFNRAERLLESEAESAELGYLAQARFHVALRGGDLDGALEHGKRMVEIGDRFGDRDLQALGLHRQGIALVAKGEVVEGLALLDEATVAAVSGELSNSATAVIYCNLISTCHDLADYRRAGEWTEAATRWCGRQAITGFPGICRVHRAEIMRLRGAWAEAEQDARRACDELEHFSPAIAAEAFYELGEIRLRVGDLAEAEDAFRQAHELGHEPQPGLAVLRLAEGKVDTAATMIQRALADESWNRLARAKLLPAQVEIALASGELERARSGAEELESIAEAYGTSVLRAAAQCARGAVRLAEGDATAACESLRRGWRLWQEVDLPYEAAQARMLLATVYRAEGDDEAAVLELQAAKSAFDRLGAVPDARRAAELLGPQAQPSRRAPPARTRRAAKTFMFTDIVKSTNLLEAMGDEAWEDLLTWHDQTLRSSFAAHGGEEVNTTGDGFFVAFDAPAEAIECAVAIQRSLAEHRREHGFAPQVRIGLHSAEATRRGRDYGGKGIHEAQRIAAFADGSEILVSHQTLAVEPGRFAVSKPRSVNLKGISQPVHVTAVEWR